MPFITRKMLDEDDDELYDETRDPDAYDPDDPDSFHYLVKRKVAEVPGVGEVEVGSVLLTVVPERPTLH